MKPLKSARADRSTRPPAGAYERALQRPETKSAKREHGGRRGRLAYTVVPSPVGRLLVAATARGLAAVSLGDSDEDLETALRREFPESEIRREPAAVRPFAAAVRRALDSESDRVDLPLDIRATAFQWRVWNELRRIPRGKTRTYAEVARRMGAPNASRAVGRACASNRVALLIPCHRVVSASGDGQYRWGAERKRRLLERERKTALSDGVGDARRGKRRARLR